FCDFSLFFYCHCHYSILPSFPTRRSSDLLMIKYLFYEGTDSLFVFDEPSLGMNEKEGKMLFSAMEKLKEQGNTILLIDHAESFQDRKSTRLNSSHVKISYAVSCLKKKTRR